MQGPRKGLAKCSRGRCDSPQTPLPSPIEDGELSRSPPSCPPGLGALRYLLPLLPPRLRRALHLVRLMSLDNIPLLDQPSPPALDNVRAHGDVLAEP